MNIEEPKKEIEVNENTEKIFVDFEKSNIPIEEQNVNMDFCIKPQRIDIDILSSSSPDKLTFSEDYNIRNVNNDIQTFTDTADTITDNEMYLRKLDEEGKWRVLRLESEVIIIWQVGSNIYYRSTNGGLDNMKMESPYAIMDIIQDDNTLKCVTNTKKILHSSDDGLTWESYDTYYDTYNGIIKASSKDNVYLINSVDGFIGNKNPKNYNTAGVTAIGIQNVIYTKKGTYLICTNSSGSIWRYSTGSSFADMDSSYKLAIQEDINSFLELNEELYLLPINKNYIYKYVNVTIYFSKNNYWEKVELPITCTITDIIYNRFDKTYYLLNDKCNYLKTTDFVTFEIINLNDIRGGYGTRSLEGLICGTLESSNNLVIVPARDKIENRLQRIKLDLDKTKWVGAGLSTDENGEKIFIKDTSTIEARENAGIFVKNNSLFLDHFNSETKLDFKKSLATFYNGGDLTPTNDFLDAWIYLDDVYNMLLDTTSPYMAIKVRWAENGTFLDPMNYTDEYTVEAWEIGVFYSNEDGSTLTYEKIGVFKNELTPAEI